MPTSSVQASILLPSRPLIASLYVTDATPAD